MQQSKNYSKQLTPSDIESEYRNCNFSQLGESDGGLGWQPIRIFPGNDTPRVFIECNLVNALPPPGSTLVRCNTTLVEMNRGNSNHHHGRMNPETFAVEAITPVERKHRPRRVTLTVSVPKNQAASIRDQIIAINGVRKVGVL